jgi:plastocyanin
LVVGPGATAKPKPLTIQAGAVHPSNKEAPYEYTRYYPDVLTVHSGQMVRWKIMGFHTVTFAKGGRSGYFRADELPGSYPFPQRTIFGSGCGRGGNPCVVNAKTSYAGSAPPLLDGSPVDFKIDLPPGTYKYFCEIHSTMSGKIRVVADGVSVPSQQQVDKQITKAVRADSAAMDSVYKADQKPVSNVDADGVRTWRVLVGDGTRDGHVQVIGFLPSSLDIPAGDRVRFTHRSAFAGDPHTVTFPTQLSGGFDPVPNGLGAFGLVPSCDFDDPLSGLPGIPGQWGFAGPPCPATLELVWAPWMTEGHPAPGNAVLTPASYHDSGLLLPERVPKNFRTLPNGAGLPSSFDADFPAPGTFSFQCDVHLAPMNGSINVS